MSSESFCHIPELKLSCFGCCTRQELFDKYSPKEIEIIIKKKHNDSSYYICDKIEFIDDMIGCIEHPGQNSGIDKRKCEANAFCITYHKLQKLSEKKKDKFLGFLIESNLNSIQYSQQIKDGSIIENFSKYLKNSRT